MIETQAAAGRRGPGAVPAAAPELAARPARRGKVVVTTLPAFAERYLSTPLFDMLRP